MATASRDGSPLLKEFLGRDPEFLPEFWTLFVLGMIIIILRFPVQIRRVGVKGLEKDDYVGIFTLATWVSTMTMVQQVYHHGSNIDVTQEQVDQLSQSDIDLLIYGSKCQEVAWYCYVSLLWSMKLTILLFYKRLIGHLWHRHVFTMVGIFATMSYTAVILTISLSCRPYPANWQVQPLPSFECAFKLTNLLVTTSLNIATDVAILILALPLLKELNVPIIKKIFVMVLLCSGVFVIAAAIMRLVLTLQGAPSTETINRWGVRECLVGAAAINAPALRPLFTLSFWRGSHKSATPVATRQNAAAHSRAAHLFQRGFKRDSVVGWWKTNMTSAAKTTHATAATTWRTWGTSESTTVNPSAPATIAGTTLYGRRMTYDDDDDLEGGGRRVEMGIGGPRASFGGDDDTTSFLAPIRSVCTRDQPRDTGSHGGNIGDIELGYVDEDRAKKDFGRTAVHRSSTTNSSV